MIQVKLALDQLYSFISKEQIIAYDKQIVSAYRKIHNKTGVGSDFLGWVDLPSGTNTDLLIRIEEHAAVLRSKSEVVVVVGAGGSYHGSRAVIEAMTHHFSHLLNDDSLPAVLFAGQNISEDYLADMCDVLDKKEYSIIVISKSGTTLEPALAFRVLNAHIEKKYGHFEAQKRIVVITGQRENALKQVANNESYESYVIPDDVGGRYSVLTPAGLFPIAVAGIDIKAFVAGARKMEVFSRAVGKIHGNPMALYAAARQALLASGKSIEVMVSYDPRLFYFTEWYKQLFSESEGKELKGIFPVSANFTTDLHSMGQYIQEGERKLFETVISVIKPERTLQVPFTENDYDQLNFLAGKRLSDVNHQIEFGTKTAHIGSDVPIISIEIPEINPDTMGQLMYFFEMSCALSSYVLGVNPFNQPSVDAYKRNVFSLLGKEACNQEPPLLE
ncbi:MAG: glucose-6-phosphate isomerase [Bacteroidetes bacterium HGW-Bacteroidetes-1]|jgi:glucose-6-phosphate isomerase|nr:MAG: glucose-6-phosphate isomerase [Bacteroidetes bacterium HGW-Bacteroidetes-1]